MTIGGNIKKLRTQEGLTQDQLGEKLFVTRQTISNWERGASQPDLEQLEKIAEALGVDVMTLIYGPKPKFRPSWKRLTVGIVLLVLGAALGIFSVLWLEPTLMEAYRRTYIFGTFYIYIMLYPALTVLIMVWGAMTILSALVPLGLKPRVRRICLGVGILFGLLWFLPWLTIVGMMYWDWELPWPGMFQMIWTIQDSALSLLFAIPCGIFLYLALIRPPKGPA